MIGKTYQKTFVLTQKGIDLSTPEQVADTTVKIARELFQTFIRRFQRDKVSFFEKDVSSKPVKPGSNMPIEYTKTKDPVTGDLKYTFSLGMIEAE